MYFSAYLEFRMYCYLAEHRNILRGRSSRLSKTMILNKMGISKQKINVKFWKMRDCVSFMFEKIKLEVKGADKTYD